MKNYLKIISIDDHSITPKYVQLTNSILRGIESGKIESGDVLPSINDFSCALDTARSTIERSYNQLKKLGVVGAIPGKGFFVCNTEVRAPIKVLLLFNKLSSHKKIIYDSFITTLGDQVPVDFYIYNNNFGQFRKLIQSKAKAYSYCVLIPHFLDGREQAHEIINTIPRDTLVLVDKLVPGVDGSYGAVYEDFENDIFQALGQLYVPLSKYSSLGIIFPDYTYYPLEILTGFKKFCRTFGIKYKIVRSVQQEQIEPGAAYISLNEDDLVALIEKVIAAGLAVGRDIGVISYNETLVKKMILNGITTISTDFSMMGEMAARLVLDSSKEKIAIPFKVTIRNSL